MHFIKLPWLGIENMTRFKRKLGKTVEVYLPTINIKITQFQTIKISLSRYFIIEFS